MSRHVDVFMHIPKTGGTTLNTIIKRMYKPDEILDHESLAGKMVGLHELTPAQKNGIKVVAGHYYYGVHEHFSASASYFTLLRDPIERVVSMYYFLRTYPGYERLQQMTLEQFAIAEGEAHDQQTFMLAGLERGRDPVAAKAHLATFAVVGVTEMFDETLFMLSRRYGWDDISYTKVNVGKDRLAVGEVGSRAVELIRQHNQLDFELHSIARERLLTDLESLAPSDRQELEAYRQQQRSD